MAYLTIKALLMIKGFIFLKIAGLPDEGTMEYWNFKKHWRWWNYTNSSYLSICQLKRSTKNVYDALKQLDKLNFAIIVQLLKWIFYISDWFAECRIDNCLVYSWKVKKILSK